MGAESRCVPSWDTDLRDALRVGDRVEAFFDLNIDGRQATGRIETLDPLTLAFETTELFADWVQVGKHLFVGMGLSERGMLFVCRAQVLAAESRRLTLSSLGEPLKMPRRHFARAPLGWQFQLIDQRGSPSDWNSCNVSGGGALLSCEHPIEAPTTGSQVHVRFTIPGRGDMRSAARVVRSQTAPGKATVIAVQFLGLEHADEMRIQLQALRAIGRRYLRVRISVPCALESSGERHVGETINLSGSGALIAVPLDSTLPDSGTLAVSLGDESIRMEDARVVRVSRKESALHAAVTFPDVERTARVQLVEWLMAGLRNV